MSDEEFLKYRETRRSSKLRYVLVQGITFRAFLVFLLVLLIGFISGATDSEVLLATLPALGSRLLNFQINWTQSSPALMLHFGKNKTTVLGDILLTKEIYLRKISNKIEVKLL